MSAPLDPPAAVAAVDALLHAWASGSVDGDRGERPTGTVHLHATDTEGEWLLVLGPDARRVTRAHAKGDAALRGPAAALLAVLEARATAADGGLGLECFGDETVLETLLETLIGSSPSP